MGSLPQVVEDCMGVLQLFSDGTVFRLQNIDFPTQPVADQSVLYKDCLFDTPHNLRLRLYRPTTAVKNHNRRQVPVLVYFRGGGFCVGSRDWPTSHNSCQRLCSALGAVVVSPDYRLAPEDRLPAAMEDGVAAMRWLQGQAGKGGGEDGWFEDVDFGRVFVLGDSSGGNIAHHVAVRLGAGSTGLGAVRVRGYVLLAPFFGGVSRTESEDGPREEMMSLEDLDRFWRLSLPVGEDRDHPLANPFGAASVRLEKVAMGPVLVVVGECELLRDRARDYVTRLAKMGKKVEYVEVKGKQHGFFTNDPYSETSSDLVNVLNRFMLDNSV